MVSIFGIHTISYAHVPIYTMHYQHLIFMISFFNVKKIISFGDDCVKRAMEIRNE